MADELTFIVNPNRADILGRVSAILEARDGRILPLYNVRPEDERYLPQVEPPMSHYWRVEMPAETTRAELQRLAQEIRQAGAQDATVIPGATLATTERLAGLLQAVISGDDDSPDFWKPLATAPGPSGGSTPDFFPFQRYLQPAEVGGIDAVHAWSKPGGDGAGIQVADVEHGWDVGHESLALGGAIEGSDDMYKIAHGTAVLGMLLGDRPAAGGSKIRGICPAAQVQRIAIGTAPAATAITTAMGALNAGDVLLLEVQREGPFFLIAGDDDSPDRYQKRYLPLEFWEQDHNAIVAAVNKGITVVEAAGNGGEDLDDPLYASFWKDPLHYAPDSGAIMVGAGAPPRGMTLQGDRIWGPDWGGARSRLGFSNYGCRVDVQAWGKNVVTAGYGDLQGGGNPARWYTARFGGTSAAAAMVAGAVACLQGNGKAVTGKGLYTPDAIRRMFWAQATQLQTPWARPGRMALPAWPGAGAAAQPKGWIAQRIGSLPDLASHM